MSIVALVFQLLDKLAHILVFVDLVGIELTFEVPLGDILGIEDCRGEQFSTLVGH